MLSYNGRLTRERAGTGLSHPERTGFRSHPNVRPLMPPFLAPSRHFPRLVYGGDF